MASTPKRITTKRRTWREKALGGSRRSAGTGQAAKPAAPRVDHEGSEQKALISWLHGEWRRGSEVGQAYPVTYHVPNGGARHKRTAGELKAQGVKAGVSDLVVMEARGGLHGLYLELKAPPPRNASLATSQRDWLALADERGYGAVLAQGLEEARQVLREYMALPPTRVAGAVQRIDAGTEWRK